MRQSNVPALRFAGFTDAWEKRQFDKLVFRVSETSSSNSLPKVEFEDINAGQGTLNKDISCKLDDRRGILFKPRDVLFGKLRPYLKNWLFPSFSGVALGDFWVLRSQELVPEFLYTLIQSDKYQRVANDTSGTKMPRSDWNLVSSTMFEFPKEHSEQTAIGSFFVQLDLAIALQEKKLENMKIAKKTLLKLMFLFSLG